MLFLTWSHILDQYLTENPILVPMDGGIAPEKINAILSVKQTYSREIMMGIVYVVQMQTVPIMGLDV
jgi:hypothetical protein